VDILLLEEIKRHAGNVLKKKEEFFHSQPIFVLLLIWY